MVRTSTGALFAGMILFAGSDAFAGGLCGEGGFFRGTIGQWCDDLIEEPITTPVVRGATVVVTTGVGTVVGGALGAPLVGAAVGEYVGQTINERAAGKSPPIGRPAVHGGAGRQEGRATFRITSKYSYIVYVRIFSQDRDVIWPGAHGAYELKDSEAHDLTIQCNVGEKICYGAYDDAKSYWGVGRRGDKGCKDCCQTCDPMDANLYSASTLVD